MYTQKVTCRFRWSFIVITSVVCKPRLSSPFYIIHQTQSETSSAKRQKPITLWNNTNIRLLPHSTWHTKLKMRLERSNDKKNHQTPPITPRKSLNSDIFLDHSTMNTPTPLIARTIFLILIKSTTNSVTTTPTSRKTQTHTHTKNGNKINVA